MKRASKILAIVLCLTLVLTMLAACGTNGTYYLVVNGEKSDEWIKISGDEWEDSNGTTGSVSVDGDEITLSYSVLGISFDFMVLEKDGSTLTSKVLGIEYKK